MYVFTINGFPYGAFHGTPVKAEVYRPDWRDPERLRYTNQLADLLAGGAVDYFHLAHWPADLRLITGDACPARRG